MNLCSICAITALHVLVNCKKRIEEPGYYHGYKGYRFAGIAKNRLHLQSFEQISSLNSFDMALKSLIYPRIIAVETALKNYTFGRSSSRCRVTILALVLFSWVSSRLEPFDYEGVRGVSCRFVFRPKKKNHRKRL